jgi:hypothetical protein
MNESTLIQLKILVERAVRPVRASTAHKRKIREELLAHVTAVFEEESARLGDERAALQRADLRFGKPGELTAQLQESVPSGDVLDRFIERVLVPPGESTLRRALRHASLIGLLVLVVLGIAGGAYWSLDSFLYSASVAVSMFLMVFEFYLLGEWMRQAQFGPAGFSWLESLRVALVGSLVFPPSLYFPHLLFGREVQMENLMLLAVLFGMTMVAMLAVLARSADAQFRRQQAWANLEIDGENGASA